MPSFSCSKLFPFSKTSHALENSQVRACCITKLSEGIIQKFATQKYLSDAIVSLISKYHSNVKIDHAKNMPVRKCHFHPLSMSHFCYTKNAKLRSQDALKYDADLEPHICQSIPTYYPKIIISNGKNQLEILRLMNHLTILLTIFQGVTLSFDYDPSCEFTRYHFFA